MQKMCVAVIGLIVASVSGPRALGQALVPVARQGVGVPAFEADPAWPPKLPNQWVLGTVPSVAVDRHDHVWVLNRPRTVADSDKDRTAPAVLELDAAGKFVRGWGGPAAGYEWPDSEHVIYVDDKDDVWIGGNAGTYGGLALAVLPSPWRDDDMLLKFTANGEFVRQFGRRDASGGNTDTSNLREPTEVFLLRKANELFVADGYGNRRVIVLDAGTGAFKRMWGAFGNVPADPPPPRRRGTAAPPSPDIAGPGPPQFGSVHGVKVSNDGRVYVADLDNRRVQVFTVDGKYLTQVLIGPAGSISSAVAFSPDKQQQFLYVADGSHSRIVVLNRKTLAVVGQFVQKGLTAHHIAVDSKGNIYTAELRSGVQKLAFKGMSPAATQ